jgi:hypothetical protein
LDTCLEKLVPVLQQGMVEFMARPEPVLQLIVTLNKEYSSPFPYPIEQASAGVEVMKNDGLVENPASLRGAAFGALDTHRVRRMLDILGPIYGGQKKAVPADATPEALATNQYLDASIRLPGK